MLKQYRRQFILLNMCLIGIILFLMLSVVGIYICHDYYDELRTTMSEVIKPLSSPASSSINTASSSQKKRTDTTKQEPEKKNSSGSKTNNSNKDRDNKQSNLSSKERKGINTVFYTQKSGDISILSNELIFDEDTIAKVIPIIINQEENFGILYHYNMIYYCSGGEEVSKIAITTISYLGESIIKLGLILFSVFVVSMILLYFISCKISFLAIKPLDDAMIREKQFITDASHDLKTPLTVILANNNILQSNPQASVAEQMKWIDSTATAAHNMQTLVNNLLTLSQIESSESILEMEIINISDIVEKAVLQMESIAYDNEIELTSEIESNIHIRANCNYFLHIVSSLIENALKYEPKHGHVLVHLSSKKGAAILTVTNLNSVIPAEDLPHIFERFYRVDKTREAANSYGLGLAITKRITESMNGTIRVTSNIENGTEFSIRFKL